MIPIRALRSDCAPVTGTDRLREEIAWLDQRIINYQQNAKPAPPPVVLMPEPPKENPFVGRISTAKRLSRSIAHDFGLSVAEMLGNGRSLHLVNARAVMAKLLRERGKSYPEIATSLHRVGDHSTAINAIKKWPIYYSRSATVRQSYARHQELIAEADGLLAEAAE